MFWRLLLLMLAQMAEKLIDNFTLNASPVIKLAFNFYSSQRVCVWAHTQISKQKISLMACCFNLSVNDSSLAPHFWRFHLSSSSHFFPSPIAANESCPWRKLGVENKLAVGTTKSRSPFVFCCRRSLWHFLGQSSSFSPLSLPPNAHCRIVGRRNNGKVGPDAARGCRIFQQRRDPPEISAIPKVTQAEGNSRSYHIHEENFRIQLFLNGLRQN